MTTTTRLGVVACAATVLALALSVRGLPSEPDRIDATHATSSQAAPAAAPPQAAIVLSPNIPGDVNFRRAAPGESALQKLQDDFDIFSWIRSSR